MIGYELKIIKRQNMILITTDDKYDVLNEEYFKISNEVIRMVYNFFSNKYEIFEFKELSCNETEKVEKEKLITLNQSIFTKLINRIIKGVTSNVIFKKFESSKLDNEFIDELYLVGDINENEIFLKLSTVTATNIEELINNLILTFPFVMTIFDSSDISIYCKNAEYLEALYYNFISFKNIYHIKL
jgi:hypothetical protein